MTLKQALITLSLALGIALLYLASNYGIWGQMTAHAQGSPKHEPFSVYPYGNTCVFVIRSDQDRNSPVGITAVPMDYVGNFCLPQ